MLVEDFEHCVFAFHVFHYLLLLHLNDLQQNMPANGCASTDSVKRRTPFTRLVSILQYTYCLLAVRSVISEVRDLYVSLSLVMCQESNGLYSE